MNKVTWDNTREIRVRIQDDTYTYIKHAIGIFHQCLRCIYYHRTIKSIMKNDTHDSSAAFISISNALMESSVIGWIKLFGSEKEDTYFTKIVDNKVLYTDFKDYFKKVNVLDIETLKLTLLQSLGMSNDEFREYSDNMKKFRDKLIAHTDLSLHRIPRNIFEEQKQNNSRLKNYPHLDPAEKSLSWFYNLITEILISKNEKDGNCIFKYPALDVVKNLTRLECEELNNALNSR